ncbi:MAG: hypothetical protein PHX61_09475 [Alphaproteobacteria bacterium]|nr:hypothetical protein [Alphaproteobacteria bacterium]
MIEAATAVTSNAQLLRAVAEQTATTQSFAANPTRVQAAAITAPYLSPHVDLNGGSSKPIFVVRDLETGARIRQFPTEGQIKAYQRAKEVQGRAQAQAASTVDYSAQQKQAEVVENSVEFRESRKEVKVAQQQLVPGGSGQTADVSVSTAAPTQSQPQSGTSLDTQA